MRLSPPFRVATAARRCLFSLAPFPRRFASSSAGTLEESGFDHLLHHRLPITQPMGFRFSSEELYRATFPASRIRNFCIVAHIDHGKTTLSDAILRRTSVLDIRGAVGTYMDKLQVEQERGITVKAQTCTIFVTRKTEIFMLNLIDTPGHVDFTYEVSRSLAACEGAVLLVDASQGVQAQTLANLQLALEAGLTIVPALSKLDAVQNDAVVDRTLTQLEDTTGLLRSETILTAARCKRGIEMLLEAILDKVQPPADGSSSSPLRALVFDTWTDFAPRNESIMCLVRIASGSVKKGSRIAAFHAQKFLEVLQVGLMYPEATPTLALGPGQVGFVRLPSGCRITVGETIVDGNTQNLLSVKPFPGFRITKPVVFAGFFPDQSSRLDELESAVAHLRVTDPSVTVAPMNCSALGGGLQLGFLGPLHLSIFRDRLLQEYDQAVLVTPPHVYYRYLDNAGAEHDLTVLTWKERTDGVKAYLEPIVVVTIVTPPEYRIPLENVAVADYRGVPQGSREEAGKVVMQFRMPLGEFVRGFFDTLKSISHGFATMEYDEPVYEESDLVKVDVVVHKQHISSLSVICHRRDTQRVGKRLVAVLHACMERTIVEMAIQACVGNKVIARETLGAVRKDVLAKIHAGDPTRAQRKLDHQKEGKRRIAKRMIGSVCLDQDTMIAAMGATVWVK